MTPSTKAQPTRWLTVRLGWAFVMGWVVALTLAVTWPLFVPRVTEPSGASTGLQFLLRDMVILPHPPLTDAALGIGDSAARATPQDTALWALGYFLDATHAVRLLIVLAVFLGGLAAAELARTVVRAGVVSQVAAATIVIWNPFVVERLLQGQWSLVIAAMMLPCVVLATNMGRHWWRASAIALAGLTPTGALLAGAAGVVAARSWRDRALVCLTTLTVSAPCLIASLVNFGASASSDPAGAAAFAARAERHVGTLGALLGLGGVWNKQVVPASREVGLSALAVVALLALFALGFSRVWQAAEDHAVQPAATAPANSDGITRAESPAMARRMILLGGVAIILVALFATTPGLALMRALQEHVPGAGLLRDTQKWIALALPAYALLAAAGAHRLATGSLGVLVHSGHGALRQWLAGAVAVLVIISAVPTLPADLSPLRPTHMWSGWAPVSGVIAMSDDAVAVLPTGSYRVIDGVPVFDPATKALPAPVVSSGELVVSGQSVGGEGTSAVDKALTAADSAAKVTEALSLLRQRGIGWVLAENSPGFFGASQAVLNQLDDVYTDSNLALYRVPGAMEKYPTATETQRTAAWVGMTLWLLVLVSGPLVALVRRRR